MVDFFSEEDPTPETDDFFRPGPKDLQAPTPSSSSSSAPSPYSVFLGEESEGARRGPEDRPAPPEALGPAPLLPLTEPPSSPVEDAPAKLDVDDEQDMGPTLPPRRARAEPAPRRPHRA